MAQGLEILERVKDANERTKRDKFQPYEKGSYLNGELNSYGKFVHHGCRPATTLWGMILLWLLWLKTRIKGLRLLWLAVELHLWWLTSVSLDWRRWVLLESTTGLLEDILASS